MPARDFTRLAHLLIFLPARSASRAASFGLTAQRPFVMISMINWLANK
jgi:hypothetical protein